MNSDEAIKTIKGYMGLDVKAIELLLPICEDLDSLGILTSMLKDLFTNHIVLVCNDDGAQYYFEIKNSKGKERSYMSKQFADVWKNIIDKVMNDRRH